MFQTQLGVELFEAAVFLFQVLEALQLAHAHAPKLAFPRVKSGLTDAVLPANLDHGLALVLLAQNSQNLGFAEAAFFHKQLKIGEVKSYYFSLFLTGSLLGEAYTYANQDWNGLYAVQLEEHIEDITAARCSHCNKFSFWNGDHCVYPFIGAAPIPNEDMPEDVAQLYEEARNIVSISPRAAAALLRLCVQMLCKHLGKPGKNINDDIANLVKNGLPVAVQMALDGVRIVGNGAVHPAEIDFNDDPSIAQKLFAMVNYICDNQLTQPKMAAQFYDANVSPQSKAAIARRDGSVK